MHSPPANPFSTSRTRPGELPFLFSAGDGTTVAKLVGRLREHNWRGAIVGPHGTGKTTLLTHLLAAVRASGKRVTTFTLHDRQRRLPRGWQDGIATDSLVAVDGYEQLSYFARWSLQRLCRRRATGLLVTAHSATALPTLYETRPSLDVARRIVSQLAPADERLPSDDELAHLLDMFHGNLREVLFALYDRYEM